jgi:hypothetical protein
VLSLQAIVYRYMDVLGMPAWPIEARYALPGEIRPGSVGQLNWAINDGHFTGTILVAPIGAHDHEVTVVHELCHIPLLKCPPRGRRAAACQELAIDQFAEALVKLARR